MKRAFTVSLDYVKKADMLLLALSLICSIFGLILIWSSTRNLSGGAGQFLPVQIGALVLGVVCFVLFSAVDLDSIATRWKFLLVFNVLILLSLRVFGYGIAGGYRIWLRFFGIGIQPSEIVKITFIVMFAYHIQYLKEYKNLNSFFSLAQLAVHLGYLLVLLPDLGNTLIFIFVFIAMLFLAGVKLRWFALGGALVAAVMPIVWGMMNEYQRYRILAPFDPTIDPLNLHWNFQPHRSQMAIGAGQVTGQGIGQGTQTQSGGVPEQWTDFIFSAAGEELGLIGAVAVIVLLAVVIIRCFYVAAKARDTLSALACAGIGSFMLFQTLMNIGMTLGLTPVVGIALPFFGYGGSSIVTTFIAMGIVCGVKMRTVSPWKRVL
ncbi:MAG: FtsW/RodA/SpoVE family cell cycle protein [Oscillospiraceae bacterium]|nr:FtsW/RodA/SpoVE family cell cycle protein [Oscillospiraceae bacterium]